MSNAQSEISDCQSFFFSSAGTAVDPAAFAAACTAEFSFFAAGLPKVSSQVSVSSSEFPALGHWPSSSGSLPDSLMITETLGANCSWLAFVNPAMQHVAVNGEKENEGTNSLPAVQLDALYTTRGALDARTNGRLFELSNPR